MAEEKSQFTAAAAMRAAFEVMTSSGRGEAGALAVGLRREVTGVGLRALAAKMLYAAVCAPERLYDIYDAAAHGWLSGEAMVRSTRHTIEAVPANAFWHLLWELVDEPIASRRPLAFTLRTLSLAGLLGPAFVSRLADATRRIPGVAEAAANSVLEEIDIATLAQCPPGSLGAYVHREAVRRGQLARAVDGLDLELPRLPFPLGYVNARILEANVAWAVVGGYHDDPLDEVALAAFKAAQFGHHHSALMLGLSMTSLAFQRPVGVEVAIDSILRGWAHGRETPLLLAAPWSSLWTLPIEEARATLGIQAFDAPPGRRAPKPRVT